MYLSCGNISHLQNEYFPETDRMSFKKMKNKRIHILLIF